MVLGKSWLQYIISSCANPRSFASLKVNYMTIPVYVLGAISLCIQVYYSDKLRKRGVFIVACCAPVGVGYLMCVGSKDPNVGYAGMFVLVTGEFFVFFIQERF